MTKLLIVGGMLCAVLAATGEAQAQDAKRIGLVFGTFASSGGFTPAGVAFHWELSDRIAVQPEIYFLDETVVFGTSPPARDQWTLSPGLRGLLYIERWDALRIYVSPRVAHIFAKGIGPLNTGPSVSGTFGAQYQLGSRISFYAEAGAEYTRLRTSSDNAFSINGLFGSRQAAGAILFF